MNQYDTSEAAVRFYADNESILDEDEEEEDDYSSSDLYSESYSEEEYVSENKGKKLSIYSSQSDTEY